MNNRELLLAYYGDDFTGSTDALESLSLAGARTVLFIEPPGPAQLKRFENLQAVGVAGMTRAMTPAAMEKELRRSFKALKTLGASHVHYKVCSTFDSSPTIGSIGKAIDVGADIFDSPFVPLLVAAPALGRYCVFGNLFARMGIGSQGSIHRLDRHPSMSCHPVTPADESDLRLHLSKQTERRIGLMDILQVALPATDAENVLKQIVAGGSEIILIDALYQKQMACIGNLLDQHASSGTPLFSVGSSGIETALGNHWTEVKKLTRQTQWPNPGRKEPLLVVSGSCSPVTSKQIAYALSRGFEELAIDTEAIATEGFTASVIEDHIRRAVGLIRDRKNIILHTSNGDRDTRVARTAEIFSRKGLDKVSGNSKTAELFGTVLGKIINAIAAQAPLGRLVIAGGDTASYTARALGIEAVEMIAPLSPGAPLCKAYASSPAIDGLEINFKGGQVGDNDYFEMVLKGGQNHNSL